MRKIKKFQKKEVLKSSKRFNDSEWGCEASSYRRWDCEVFRAALGRIIL